MVFSIWQGPGQVINGKDNQIITVISPSGRNALLKRIRATIPESSRRPPPITRGWPEAGATLGHLAKAHTMQMN